MEAKKNEKLRLEKNSGLYFSIGLTLVLALAYIGLEWKSFEEVIQYDPGEIETALIEELPPMTIQKLPPPPPPKIQSVPEIEIVDDEDDIIETVIESDDTNQNTEILDLEDIIIEETPIDESISFIIVEDAPVFPGCENAKDQRACFQEMMLKHVRKVFRYPDAAQEMNLQGRVSVTFTIQKDGSIGDVKMRGPHKILEEEAARIISKLPKMQPGKQRGTPVKVPFSIPITFQLQ